MERGKGEPGGRQTARIYFTFPSSRAPGVTAGARSVPDEVEGGGEKQLVVDGDAHVARLVEGGGDRSDGGPEGAAPAQEQKLGYGERTRPSSSSFIQERN